MPEIYVKLILLGKKTIDDVPTNLREVVENILGEMNA